MIFETFRQAIQNVWSNKLRTFLTMLGIIIGVMAVIVIVGLGKVGKTPFWGSNVLYFDLTNDSWCCARPSGTEPKIKFYMGVKGTSLEDAQKKLDALTEEVKAVVG